MKKAIYLLMCVGVLLLASSCEKDEVGETATVALAGEWYVTVDGVDASGNVLHEDVYGTGHMLMYTYNTAANNTGELYVDDQGNFWEYKVRAKSDINALTFNTGGAVGNEYYDCNVTIEDGKVLLGAATTPSGAPADSISFYITFSDDDNVPGAYSKLKVAGYRYTGFAADE